MKKIHIVEDQMIIAMDLQFMLEDMGYVVSNLSSSYEETFEKIKLDPPDLLILDIILKTDKTGIDIAHELNLNYQIPFVFLTSHADLLTVEAAQATNPRGYLVKPFNHSDMSKVLAEAFGESEQEE